MYNPLKTLLTILFIMTSYVVEAQVVKGVVKDMEGTALAGVTIIVEGTSVGTVTGTDGAYQIDLNKHSNPVLVFSMIGMKTVYREVDGRKTINVAMDEDKTFLNEVVVVGYQEVQRKDLMGSVSSVSSERLADQPLSTVSQALAGRMAGVSVVTTEGSPDPEMKIRVRGTGSITQSSEPLYIVDGFPVDGISDLSASQIQSIDVLKDAFSTAIYGSRGANGVVIITTKII